MFFLLQEINIASYTDDNTPYVTGETPSAVISDLKLAADRIFNRFYNNAMKENQGKSHSLSSLDLNKWVLLENYGIKNTNLQKSF